MRRRPFLLLLLLLPLLVLAISNTTQGPARDLDTVAGDLAETLGRELTEERRDTITSNEEGAALVEEIARRVTKDGPDDLVISVIPELGGLLVDLAAGGEARCVFFEISALIDDDPAVLYAVGSTGCDPASYLDVVQAAAEAVAPPLQGPVAPTTTTLP